MSRESILKPSERVLTWIPDPLVPEDKEKVDSRQGIAFQKWWDWQARKRLVPQEVLRASDASTEEADFLLGKRKIDPDPFKKIQYSQLVPGEGFIVFDDSINVFEPILPPARHFTGNDLPWWRNFFGPDEPDDANIASIRKQGSFRNKVFEAIILAFNRASDMFWSEWEAIEGIKNHHGHEIRDLSPDHLPKYHPLVPTREV